MRKSAILVLAVALVVAWSGAAYAVEGLNWGVGLKGWYNEMELGIPDSSLKLKSKDPVFMLGPNVKVSYKGFFAGTSYLFTTSDYKLEVEGIELVNADRKDFDILAGYMFIPYAGAFLGYKYSKIDLEIPVFSETWKDELKLWAFGATGNYPLAAIPLTFYGNIAYLWGDWKETAPAGNSFDSDASGYSIEAGANYRIWQGLSAGLGYKYQNVKVKDKLPEVASFKEKFKGFTLSVDYNF